MLLLFNELRIIFTFCLRKKIMILNLPLLLINYSTFKLLNDGLLHLQTLTNVKTPITATAWDKSVLTYQENLRVLVSRGTIWTKVQESVLPINHHYKLNFCLVSIPTVLHPRTFGLLCFRSLY